MHQLLGLVLLNICPVLLSGEALRHVEFCTKSNEWQILLNGSRLGEHYSTLCISIDAEFKFSPSRFL